MIGWLVGWLVGLGCVAVRFVYMAWCLLVVRVAFKPKGRNEAVGWNLQKSIFGVTSRFSTPNM